MKTILRVLFLLCVATYKVYSQIDYLEFVRTDKARYSPGDTVKFEIGLDNPPASSHIVIKYRHLLQIIATDSILDLHQTQLNWLPPHEDFKGYLVEVLLFDRDSLLCQANTAVDISSDLRRYPRYGFLSKYPEITEQEMDGVISNLKDYHLNALQFYDWHYKHHVPLKGSPLNPAPYWQDVANRTNYFVTVSRYVELAHRRNVKAMSYNLLYGALDNAEADSVLPAWFLYRDAHHNVRDSLDLSFWGHCIYLLNPGDADWKNYIFQKTRDALTTFHFDGWHVDQVGDRGIVYGYGGENVIINNAFLNYLADAKNSLNVDLVMNAVNQYGQQEIAQSPVDFFYTEVWPPNTTFNSLATVLLDNLSMANGALNSVLAAYVNHDLAEHPGFFNTPAVLYADAVIFAFGGARIELGEHMLGHEYFPNENLIMTGELKNKLKVYYDFLVAYENLLRDQGTYMPAELSTNDSISLIGWPPQLGGVSTLKKRFDTTDVFHLINFKGATTLDWRDNSGTQHEPDSIGNLSVSFQSPRTIKHLWLASPDFNSASASELEFELRDNEVSFIIPRLRYWDMIVVEYDTPSFVEDSGLQVAANLNLFPNYPNPFNPSTTFKFEIAQPAFVTLKVFDLLGKEVATLVNEDMKPGVYSKIFHGNNFASGPYLCRLQAGSSTQTRKLLLLR